MTETLYAAYLLLKIIEGNPKLNNETEFSQFWNLVLNPDKALFLNEKFLFQFSVDGIISCITLIKEKFEITTFFV